MHMKLQYNYTHTTQTYMSLVDQQKTTLKIHKNMLLTRMKENSHKRKTLLATVSESERKTSQILICPTQNSFLLWLSEATSSEGQDYRQSLPGQAIVFPFPLSFNLEKVPFHVLPRNIPEMSLFTKFKPQ